MNCGNVIAEMEGKKLRNLLKSKKKKKFVMSKIFLQYFHNESHMISYYQFKKICDKLIVALPKLEEKKIVRT